MRRFEGHFAGHRAERIGRMCLGAAALLGALAIGGCGTTPRMEFFEARAVTFKAVPGGTAPGSDEMARGRSVTELASSLGVGR